MGIVSTDTGGVTREFFTLLVNNITRKYMIGGMFTHNSMALQVFSI